MRAGDEETLSVCLAKCRHHIRALWAHRDRIYVRRWLREYLLDLRVCQEMVEFDQHETDLIEVVEP